MMVQFAWQAPLARNAAAANIPFGPQSLHGLAVTRRVGLLVPRV